MPLFRRHSADPASSAQPPEHVAGLHAAMMGRGWQPAPSQPFDGKLEQQCTHVALTMHKLSSSPLGPDPAIQGSNFRDSYRGMVDGRSVTVANAWLLMRDNWLSAIQPFHGTSVCAVQLPTLVAPTCVQPRTFRPAVPLAEVPTGDHAFDERYSVRAAPGLGPQLLTAPVRQLILARDDWIFLIDGALLGCIGRGAFEAIDDVWQRIDDVMNVVRAIPTSVMPDHVDRSVDDLMARISAVDDIDGALALLQSLSDSDRERLARSTTPLSVMADVRTPEEAMQRFEALSMDLRAQLLAMFGRIDG